MKLPILCYHKVGPVEEEGRSINVEPKVLAQHIRYFFRKGAKFLQAWELQLSWPKCGVCLTFDDAFQSTLTYGLEVMLRGNATGTIFTAPALLGKPSPWSNVKQTPIATWEMLQMAQSKCFEIGNHTLNHAPLGKLSLEEQIQQIKRAHNILVEHGIQSQSFCYPYGSYNNQSKVALQMCDYNVGIGLSNRMAIPQDSRYLLPRINVSCSDYLPKLLYRIYIRPLLPSFKKRPHYIP